MKVAICDDQAEIVCELTEKLKRFFEEKGCVESISYSSYDECGKLYRDHCESPFDLLILDIMMSDDTPGGFEVSKRIRSSGGDKRVSDVPIIFVSSRNDMVFQSFEFSPVYFVPKVAIFGSKADGCGKNALYNALSKFYKDFIFKGHRISFETVDGKTIAIPTDKVNYIESFGHKLTVHCSGSEYTIRGSLNRYAEALADFGFINVHKSYLVNMRKVRGFDKTDIRLVSGETLPVSRRCLPTVKNKFHQVLKEM